MIDNILILALLFASLGAILSGIRIIALILEWRDENKNRTDKRTHTQRMCDEHNQKWIG